MGSKFECFVFVLTMQRLAYLCCQCVASLDMKLALASEVSGEGILKPVL